MKVLELAAGPAMLSKAIALSCESLEVTDFSTEMLAQEKKKGLPKNVTFAAADATNLQYEDGRFDAVVIANALHIMPEPIKPILDFYGGKDLS
ncbi:MAG: class I SAM-dependent methyltransferase [bacterium]|nr:class I SAM-dependent methyltransferase [bacterium]